MSSGEQRSSQPTVELRAHSSLAEIPAESWDRLDGVAGNPFLTWEFLSALEETGCVVPRRGWHPCHLTAWDGETLMAAAPAYVKADGMGDFSRDWGFAEILRHFGGSPYPKLVVGVPFSPVSGRRILTAPGVEVRDAALMLMTLARELAKINELESIQVLYHDASESQGLERAGLASRVLVQYHWYNHDYRSAEDWLARLTSKRRNQARRERREPERQGIDLRTLRSEQIAADPERWADVAHDLYRTTCEKYMWGGAYLNRAFFRRIFASLTDHVELVLAEQSGRPIAGAINLATPTKLWGRYWGCHQEHRFLHFNVCLYHSIDDCIERGRLVFEGGAGGEHKLSRGFEPSIVHCAQWFALDEVQAVVGRALEADTRRRIAEVERWRELEGLGDSSPYPGG